MSRLKVVLNPEAGRGYAARIEPQIKRYLADLGVEFDLVRTEGRGHAIELTQQALRQCVEKRAVPSDKVIDACDQLEELGGPKYSVASVRRGGQKRQQLQDVSPLDGGEKVSQRSAEVGGGH